MSQSLASCNPLVPDYIKSESRGIATAFVSVSSSLGAIISIKYLFGELKTLDYKHSAQIVATIQFLITLFLLYGVKDITKGETKQR